MKVHDSVTSTIQRAKSTSVRRAKIEKMRLDHSATTIQSMWRGVIRRRAHREIFPDLKKPTSKSSSGVNYAKILPVDMCLKNENNVRGLKQPNSSSSSGVNYAKIPPIDVSLKNENNVRGLKQPNSNLSDRIDCAKIPPVDVSLKNENNVRGLKQQDSNSSSGVNYSKIPPIDVSLKNKNNIEDGDEGVSDTKREIDDEEAIAMKAAENVEESLIMDASGSQLLPSWPQPLVDNFEDKAWPDLESATSILDAGSDSSAAVPTVLLRVITWNLCARKPPKAELCRKTLFPRNKFHLYVIGTEECERSIAQSAVNASKRVWEAFLANVLGPMYVPLRSHTLQATHIMAFAHRSIAPLCSDIASAAVATGMGNALGNKGAVGISIKIARTRFVFVNAHLAAHQNAIKQRNKDYAKISKEMPGLLHKSEMKARGKLEWRLSKSSAMNSVTSGRSNTVPSSPSLIGDSAMSFSTAPGPIKLTDDSGGNADASSPRAEEVPDVPCSSELDDCADRVVFMGDLNYRIRGNRSMVSKLLEMRMHEVMLSNDQLISCMEKNLVLRRFTEPPLNFYPTYKLDIESDEYDTGAKKRIPAWTDRVLYVPSSGFECTAYNSDTSLRTSDHRPVFASFSATIKTDHNLLDLPGGQSARSDMSMNHPAFSSETQVCSIM